MTLRPPAVPGRVDGEDRVAARCQLRAVQPLGFSPSISSNEPLATNWVTPASSSPALGAPGLQAVTAITIERMIPQAATGPNQAQRSGSREVFIVPPSRSGRPSASGEPGNGWSTGRGRQRGIYLGSAACQRRAPCHLFALTADPSPGNPYPGDHGHDGALPTTAVLRLRDDRAPPDPLLLAPRCRRLAPPRPDRVGPLRCRTGTPGTPVAISSGRTASISRPTRRAIHGITHAQALRVGRDLAEVLDEFLAAAETAGDDARRPQPRL